MKTLPKIINRNSYFVGTWTLGKIENNNFFESNVSYLSLLTLSQALKFIV